jgi:Aminoglycoside-2''-adenylyltransferase
MDLDLPRILEVLHRNKVAYILIGGLAAVYHGSPFPTEDADITPEMGRRNLDKLATALRELNARVRTDPEPSRIPFRSDGEALAAAETWNLTTDAGDLDVTFEPSGTRGYPDLRHDATQVELYGVSVRIASLADVIRSKQAANRPKDQRVLPTLREILAQRRGGGTDA